MADETTTVRRCIGSTRFGIEPHDAPIGDFPRQPSQKDGLGRMCKTHWNAYTAGLARDAKARRAAAEAAVPAEATVETRPSERSDDDAAEPPEEGSATAEQPAPRRKQRRTAATPAAGSQGDAG